MKLKNKQPAPTAIVTGAARRIGAAIVKSLHQAGFRVVIHCYQSQAEANQLAAALNEVLPNSALVVQANLCELDKLDTVIDAAVQWAGNLDVLVNNASLFVKSDVNNYETYDPKIVTDLYALNVSAPWYLSLKARYWLSQTSGSIINITDIHAETPLKGYAEYCQSKAALWMQTKALAREFAPYIRVNAVAPGAIAWPEAENSVAPHVKKQIINETPLKMHGKPEFIAQAVLALVNNPFITGQVLRVDGGRSIG